MRKCWTHNSRVDQAAVLVSGGRARACLETRRIVLSTTGPTGVEGAGGTGGPGCGARGRRRGLAGLRVDAPSGARGADGSRAGRRPRAYQAARPHWCEGRRRDLPRCRWAVAGPGRASRRRAERSSRRGRRAGGPPPTGTQSSPAQTDRAAPGTPVGQQAT